MTLYTLTNDIMRPFYTHWGPCISFLGKSSKFYILHRDRILTSGNFRRATVARVLIQF